MTIKMKIVRPDGRQKNRRCFLPCLLSIKNAFFRRDMLERQL